MTDAEPRTRLIEQIAEELWLTRETSESDCDVRPWTDAGPYWQGVMREYAHAALRVIEARAGPAGRA